MVHLGNEAKGRFIDAFNAPPPIFFEAKKTVLVVPPVDQMYSCSHISLNTTISCPIFAKGVWIVGNLVSANQFDLLNLMRGSCEDQKIYSSSYSASIHPDRVIGGDWYYCIIDRHPVSDAFILH